MHLWNLGWVLHRKCQETAAICQIFINNNMCLKFCGGRSAMLCWRSFRHLPKALRVSLWTCLLRGIFLREGVTSEHDWRFDHNVHAAVRGPAELGLVGAERTIGPVARGVHFQLFREALAEE